jgi:arabinose-5-phosphate isomerase
MASDIIKQESAALSRLSKTVPDGLSEAVNIILDCQGSVIVTGMGKAGWVGQKVSASLASTGTRSHFLHPAEAIHGDLGRVGPEDVVLALSNSGETGEIVQLLPSMDKLGVPIISIVASPSCTLARASVVVLDYGRLPEAGNLGLAPTTSTTMMMAMGDALALVLSNLRQFRPMDFAKFHPGGSLGRKLSTVDEIMRPVSDCRVAQDSLTVREIYIQCAGSKRRVGVILLTDDSGKLTGLFTDSDLARLLESGDNEALDASVSEVMTSEPITVRCGSKSLVAVETLACRNISELPVVDSHGRPKGVLDITDVVGLFPVG